jgi:hypothetical protein
MLLRFGCCLFRHLDKYQRLLFHLDDDGKFVALPFLYTANKKDWKRGINESQLQRYFAASITRLHYCDVLIGHFGFWIE